MVFVEGGGGGLRGLENTPTIIIRRQYPYKTSFYIIALNNIMLNCNHTLMRILENKAGISSVPGLSDWVPGSLHPI